MDEPESPNSRPESVEDIIAHYGVIGMHWGTRKLDSPSAGALRRASLKGLGTGDIIVRKTAAGDTVSMQKIPPNSVTKALATLSKTYTNNYNDGAFFTFKDKNGKKIGDANLWKKSNEELYLNWIGINTSARGRGYATAALKAAEEYGSQNGFKRMTLEVPGNSPDARHIYEKLGFKVTNEVVDPKEPIWGGLTSMEYKFPSATNVKHSGLADDFAWFLDGIDKYILSSIAEQEVTHMESESVEDIIAHYGVIGMHWGVRQKEATAVTVKARTPGKKIRTTGGKYAPSSADALRSAHLRQVAKKSTTDSLSDKELQALVARMNLEQQYSRLRSDPGGQGKKFATGLVGNVGKQQVTSLANGYAAKKVAKILLKGAVVAAV